MSAATETLWESSMKLKLMIVAFALAATPALAQQAGAPPAGPKPTVAQVQKVVQIISADKAKAALYCEVSKLDEQMALADEKKDTKKLEELSKRGDAMAQKLGPEYIALMTGLSQIDPDSPEGKSLGAALEPLDKACAGK
jgi:hypothetical protein